MTGCIIQPYFRERHSFVTVVSSVAGKASKSKKLALETITNAGECSFLSRLLRDVASLAATEEVFIGACFVSPNASVDEAGNFW
jgi:hypothetical protein